MRQKKMGRFPRKAEGLADFPEKLDDGMPRGRASAERSGKILRKRGRGLKVSGDPESKEGRSLESARKAPEEPETPPLSGVLEERKSLPEAPSPKPVRKDRRVKRRVMTWAHGLLTYIVLLLLVGLQVGLVVFPGFQRTPVVVQVGLVMMYWAVVAAVFMVMTNWQIRDKYDRPTRRLSEATKQVAEGDFSVYVEPLHTTDRYDYIDVMFVDFNKMVEELGSIETLKNDFVSNVSHELKTPLAIIKNYSTMVRKGSLPEAVRNEYMDTIIEATDRLSDLITNVLKLSKLDHQSIESTAEEYDLCRQLTDAVLRYESLWEEKELEIEAELEERALIIADRSMMEIVWNNLLSNAVKFTEPGGRISIVQTSDAGDVTVTVSDTGCGMSEETMKRIFDQFYQGDSSHSGEGNGLGLALAKRVVEKSGGTLSVESHVGTGSVFTVRLSREGL